ncbi:hypothetical protein Tco_0962760 [Tanacetum coccineum]
MALSIADRIALDDALVAPADRLRIGKCNLRLSSDVTSKEATLQVVYDVLKLTPFYKAFQVTADAPEIYMQEFWASAYVHNRSGGLEVVRRVEESEVAGWIDRSEGSTFGIGRKSPPENFSGGGGMMAVVAGGGQRVAG